MKKGTIAGCMLAMLMSAAPATFAAHCPSETQYPGEYGGYQKAKGSYLGVEVTDVDSDRVAALKLKDETGVEVTAVDGDAPAGKAGLREHDVILTINGTKIEGEEQLRRTIRETPAGRSVDIGISRDGQSMMLKATLAPRKMMDTYVIAPHVTPPDVHVEVPPMAMPPMHIEMPDIPEVNFRSRSIGALVENLTPQLGDYFGVKNGAGVLVRSVEKGSAAEAAGLKAGDVVIRIGQERLNDTGDWRRLLRNKSGVVTLGIIRDKREQNLNVKLPARPRESGQTLGYEFDWDNGPEMEALRKELKEIPKISQEQKMAVLKAQQDWKKEFDAHRSEWQKSIAEAQKEAAKEQQKAMKDLQKQMKELEKEFHYISFEE